MRVSLDHDAMGGIMMNVEREPVLWKDGYY